MPGEPITTYKVGHRTFATLKKASREWTVYEIVLDEPNGKPISIEIQSFKYRVKAFWYIHDNYGYGTEGYK